MTRPWLKASLAKWKRKLAYRRRKVASGVNVAKWKGLANHAESMVKRREAQLAKTAPPLRTSALKEARTLVGVMEHGGNNVGAQVTAIIRENGGTGPEPWCGDFVAHCYRKAGSKAVTRAWASVYFLGRIAGVPAVRDPKPGDIVRYQFSHTGLFVKWINRATGDFLAIEGNTGASGAVSDSATGGDGVYEKRRNTVLVTDFRRVTR